MARSKKEPRDRATSEKEGHEGVVTPSAPVTDEAVRTWQKQAAEAFKALSDPTRLRIFDVLRYASDVERETGMNVGQVCDRLISGGQSIKDASTISHHLKELRQAGLITMERDGQHRLCRVHIPTLTVLAAYLCQGTLSAPAK